MGGEYNDAHMLSKSLERIAAQALHLKDKIEAGLQLPSWAEYKVYMAYSGINKALGTAYPGVYEDETVHEHMKMSSAAAVSTQENPPALNDILFSAFHDELEKLSGHASAPNLISLRGLSDEEVASAYREMLDAHQSRLRKMEGLRPGSLRHRYNERMARMHLANANSFLEPEKRAYKMGLYAGANVDPKIGTGIVSSLMARKHTQGMRTRSQRPVPSSVASVSQPAMAKQAGYNKAQKTLLGIADTVKARGYRKAGIGITGAQHQKLKQMYNSRDSALRAQAEQLLGALAPSIPPSEYGLLFRGIPFRETGLKSGTPQDFRPGKVYSDLRKLDMLEKKNPALYDKLMRARGGDFTFRQMAAPYLKKQAEVTYRGITFPGYNKPIASNRKGKKKMVLVKKGDKVRIVHFGQKGYQDFTQHKDKARRKNYLTRSAGIRNKSGQLTKDDPFSPNYWARRKLW